MKKLLKNPLKAVAWLLVVSFFISDIGWAAPGELASIFPASSNDQKELLANPTLFQAPLESSVLREVKKGTSPTFIIHFQDAHTNLSGQLNLASALDQIMSTYKVGLVLVEGGSKDDSLTAIKPAASPEVWKKVAKKFLMEGKISGEEYLNLTSDHPMKIIGIEDKDLYMKSVNAYADLADRREAIVDYLKQIKRSLDKLKTKLYGPELLDYEKLEKTNPENVEVKFEKLIKLDSDLNLFPELQKLNAVKEKEAGIDFNLANMEQVALVDEIVKSGGGKDIKENLEKILKFRNSKATQFSYLQNTFNIAKLKNIEINRFSNLLKYRDYLQAFSEIDLALAADEMQKAEDGLYLARLNAEDARLARSIDRYLELLFTAYRIQMTTKEFRLFEANETDFTTLAYLSFINRKLLEYGFFEDVISYENHLDEGKEALHHFYDSVNERDKAFIKNTDRILKEEKEEIAVMITGGYHTAHLKELFNQKGYSYAVLSPIITSETNQTKYEKILLESVRKKEKKIDLSEGQSKKSAITVATEKIVEALNGSRLADLLKTAVTFGGNEEEAARVLLARQLAITDRAGKGLLSESNQEPIDHQILDESRAGQAPINKMRMPDDRRDGARLASQNSQHDKSEVEAVQLAEKIRESFIPFEAVVQKVDGDERIIPGQTARAVIRLMTTEDKAALPKSFQNLGYIKEEKKSLVPILIEIEDSGQKKIGGIALFFVRPGGVLIMKTLATRQNTEDLGDKRIAPYRGSGTLLVSAVARVAKEQFGNKARLSLWASEMSALNTRSPLAFYTNKILLPPNPEAYFENQRLGRIDWINNILQKAEEEYGFQKVSGARLIALKRQDLPVWTDDGTLYTGEVLDEVSLGSAYKKISPYVKEPVREEEFGSEHARMIWVMAAIEKASVKGKVVELGGSISTHTDLPVAAVRRYLKSQESTLSIYNVDTSTVDMADQFVPSIKESYEGFLKKFEGVPDANRPSLIYSIYGVYALASNPQWPLIFDAMPIGGRAVILPFNQEKAYKQSPEFIQTIADTAKRRGVILRAVYALPYEGLKNKLIFDFLKISAGSRLADGQGGQQGESELFAKKDIEENDAIRELAPVIEKMRKVSQNNYDNNLLNRVAGEARDNLALLVIRYDETQPNRIQHLSVAPAWDAMGRSFGHESLMENLDRHKYEYVRVNVRFANHGNTPLSVTIYPRPDKTAQATKDEFLRTALLMRRALEEVYGSSVVATTQINRFENLIGKSDLELAEKKLLTEVAALAEQSGQRPDGDVTVGARLSLGAQMLQDILSHADSVADLMQEISKDHPKKTINKELRRLKDAEENLRKAADSEGHSDAYIFGHLARSWESLSYLKDTFSSDVSPIHNNDRVVFLQTYTGIESIIEKFSVYSLDLELDKLPGSAPQRMLLIVLAMFLKEHPALREANSFRERVRDAYERLLIFPLAEPEWEEVDSSYQSVRKLTNEITDSVIITERPFWVEETSTDRDLELLGNDLLNAVNIFEKEIQKTEWSLEALEKALELLESFLTTSSGKDFLNGYKSSIRLRLEAVKKNLVELKISASLEEVGVLENILRDIQHRLESTPLVMSEEESARAAYLVERMQAVTRKLTDVLNQRFPSEKPLKKARIKVLQAPSLSSFESIILREVNVLETTFEAYLPDQEEKYIIHIAYEPLLLVWYAKIQTWLHDSDIKNFFPVFLGVNQVNEEELSERFASEEDFSIDRFRVSAGKIFYAVTEDLPEETAQDSILNGYFEPAEGDTAVQIHEKAKAALSEIDDILFAVLQLHQAGFRHRKLVPENIYITIDKDGSRSIKLENGYYAVVEGHGRLGSASFINQLAPQMPDIASQIYPGYLSNTDDADTAAMIQMIRQYGMEVSQKSWVGRELLSVGHSGKLLEKYLGGTHYPNETITLDKLLRLIRAIKKSADRGSSQGGLQGSRLSAKELIRIEIEELKKLAKPGSEPNLAPKARQEIKAAANLLIEADPLADTTLAQSHARVVAAAIKLQSLLANDRYFSSRKNSETEKNMLKKVVASKLKERIHALALLAVEISVVLGDVSQWDGFLQTSIEHMATDMSKLNRRMERAALRKNKKSLESLNLAWKDTEHYLSLYSLEQDNIEEFTQLSNDEQILPILLGLSLERLILSLENKPYNHLAPPFSYYSVLTGTSSNYSTISEGLRLYLNQVMIYPYWAGDIENWEEAVSSFYPNELLPVKDSFKNFLNQKVHPRAQKAMPAAEWNLIKNNLQALFDLYEKNVQTDEWKISVAIRQLEEIRGLRERMDSGRRHLADVDSIERQLNVLKGHYTDRTKRQISDKLRSLLEDVVYYHSAVRMKAFEDDSIERLGIDMVIALQNVESLTGPKTSGTRLATTIPPWAVYALKTAQSAAVITLVGTPFLAAIFMPQMNNTPLVVSASLILLEGILIIRRTLDKYSTAAQKEKLFDSDTSRDAEKVESSAQGARLAKSSKEKAIPGDMVGNLSVRGRAVIFDPNSAEEILYVIPESDLDEAFNKFYSLVAGVKQALGAASGGAAAFSKDDAAKINYLEQKAELVRRSNSGKKIATNPMALLIRAIKQDIQLLGDGKKLKEKGLNGITREDLEDILDIVRAQALVLAEFSRELGHESSGGNEAGQFQHHVEIARKELDRAAAIIDRFIKQYKSLMEKANASANELAATKERAQKRFDEAQKAMLALEQSHKKNLVSDKELELKQTELAALKARLEKVRSAPAADNGFYGAFVLSLEEIKKSYFSTDEAITNTAQRMVTFNRNFASIIYEDMLLAPKPEILEKLGIKLDNTNGPEITMPSQKGLFSVRRRLLRMLEKQSQEKQGIAINQLPAYAMFNAINDIIGLCNGIIADLVSSAEKTAELYRLDITEHEDNFVLVVDYPMSVGTFLQIWNKYGPRISGIIASQATRNSHWVIVAQGLANPPPILITKEKIPLIKPGDELMVSYEPSEDQGVAYLHPVKARLKKIAAEQKKQGLIRAMIMKAISVLKDRTQLRNFPFRVRANVVPGQWEGLEENDTDGVGLVRTEVLDQATETLLNEIIENFGSGAHPDSNERLLVSFKDTYKALLELPSLQGKFVTFRTLDMQWDKDEELLGRLRELKDAKPDLFKGIDNISGFNFYRTVPGKHILIRQIAALYLARLSLAGNAKKPRLRIMFPQVRDTNDLDYIRDEILPEVKKIVVQEMLKTSNDKKTRTAESINLTMGRMVEFGVMIETNESLDNIQDILKHELGNFLSVGTNDLTADILSKIERHPVSRDNPFYEEQFSKLNPHVLKRLESLAWAVSNYNITYDPKNKRTLGFCGEIAGAEKFLLFMVYLHNLYKIPMSSSMSVNRIPLSKFLLMESQKQDLSSELRDIFANPNELHTDKQAAELAYRLLTESEGYKAEVLPKLKNGQKGARLAKEDRTLSEQEIIQKRTRRIEHTLRLEEADLEKVLTIIANLTAWREKLRVGVDARERASEIDNSLSVLGNPKKVEWDRIANMNTPSSKIKAKEFLLEIQTILKNKPQPSLTAIEAENLHALAGHAITFLHLRENRIYAIIYAETQKLAGKTFDEIYPVNTFLRTHINQLLTVLKRIKEDESDGPLLVAQKDLDHASTLIKVLSLATDPKKNEALQKSFLAVETKVDRLLKRNTNAFSQAITDIEKDLGRIRRNLDSGARLTSAVQILNARINESVFLYFKLLLARRIENEHNDEIIDGELEKMSGQTILDLGSGKSAPLANFLIQDLGFKNVYALDQNLDADFSGINFIRKTIQSVGDELNGKFEKIIAIRVLKKVYVPDMEATAMKLRSFLKPGGELMVLEADREYIDVLTRVFGKNNRELSTLSEGVYYFAKPFGARLASGENQNDGKQELIDFLGANGLEGLYTLTRRIVNGSYRGIFHGEAEKEEVVEYVVGSLWGADARESKSVTHSGSIADLPLVQLYHPSKGKPESYVGTAIQNKIRDFLRKARQSQKSKAIPFSVAFNRPGDDGDSVLDGTVSHEPNPSDSAIAKESGILAKMFTSLLDERVQRIYKLHFEQEKTIEEIARSEQLHPSGVKRILRQARGDIQAGMESPHPYENALLKVIKLLETNGKLSAYQARVSGLILAGFRLRAIAVALEEEFGPSDRDRGVYEKKMQDEVLKPLTRLLLEEGEKTGEPQIYWNTYKSITRKNQALASGSRLADDAEMDPAIPPMQRAAPGEFVIEQKTVSAAEEIEQNLQAIRNFEKERKDLASKGKTAKSELKKIAEALEDFSANGKLDDFYGARLAHAEIQTRDDIESLKNDDVSLYLFAKFFAAKVSNASTLFAFNFKATGKNSRVKFREENKQVYIQFLKTDGTGIGELLIPNDLIEKARQDKLTPSQTAQIHQTDVVQKSADIFGSLYRQGLKEAGISSILTGKPVVISQRLGVVDAQELEFIRQIKTHIQNSFKNVFFKFIQIDENGEEKIIDNLSDVSAIQALGQSGYQDVWADALGTDELKGRLTDARNQKARVFFSQAASHDKDSADILPYAALYIGSILVGRMDEASDGALQFISRLTNFKFTKGTYSLLVSPDPDDPEKALVYRSILVKPIARIAIDRILEFTRSALQAIGAAA